MEHEKYFVKDKHKIITLAAKMKIIINKKKKKCY